MRKEYCILCINSEDEMGNKVFCTIRNELKNDWDCCETDFNPVPDYDKLKNDERLLKNLQHEKNVGTNWP